MRTKKFIRALDHDRIVEAIRRVESKTSGEVRVYIQRGKLDRDVLAIAQEKFQSLGVQNTAARNGVLIFVAPRMQQFAVLGDQGIHQRCGDDLWQRVVDKMSVHFKESHYTDALVEAISDLGEVLAQQFPRQAGDVNELPDVVEGE
ncbi:MAG TPA: TPM domain-containing protein [Chthoniobacterales bacterium]|nr:TPM domain-containing protein [Chthoniobacterales bacterium]